MTSKRIEHVVILAILLLFVLAVSAHAQHTTVTANVFDPIGNPYTSCNGSASFVGQNNAPGAGPYVLGGSTFQTVVPINCDSFAHFTVSLADNNQITPTPSQWRFTICAPVGLSAGGVPPPICFNAQLIITGASQDITTALQAVSALLPVNGGSSVLLARTVSTLPSAVSNPGAMYRVTDALSTSDCTVGGGTGFTSVCFSNGTFWQSIGGSGGGVTPGGLSTQIQFNNSGTFGGLTAGPAGSPIISEGATQNPQFASGITYATTALNWTQFSVPSLTGGLTGTVVLTPCPVGVDYTSGAGYQVYITDGASSEAVAVTSGSTGSGNCSITFTPFFSHTSYTIGSASSGIQETINAACGVSSTWNFNGQCNVTLPANGPYLSGPTFTLNNYQIYGTIFWHASQSGLNSTGTTLFCHERGPCLQIGDQVNSNHYKQSTIQGITFRSPDDNSANPAYNGCAITQTQATGTMATITSANPCGFRPGDLISIQFTDDKMYWGDAIVATASGTSFTFSKNSFTTKAPQTTPGVVALSYEAVLDNSTGTHLLDVSYDQGGELGSFNHFFDFWDDENALIDHFNNNGSALTKNANWTGSFVYSGGGPIGPAGNLTQQWAPVITLRNSSITAQFSNGVTVDNSNGVLVENSVIQATGPWQVKTTNTKGNFQGASISNIYSESNVTANPSCTPGPCYSPFGGTGIAGLIAGQSSITTNYSFAKGITGLAGAFATGGAGATPYSYFIVANDTTANTQTSPMQVLDWLSTGSDTITVRWPRIANGTDTITYDVIRMTTPVGVGAIYPYVGGCTGGSGGTCGYVALGISQATACAGALTCTYSDTGSSTTSAYTIKQANYAGQLNFWPGAIVTETTSVKTTVEEAPVVGIGLNGNPVQIAQQCSQFGAASSGGYTSCLESVSLAGNSIKNQTATLLSDGPNSGDGMTLTKGRLNFTSTQSGRVAPHHIITLIDSQPALTQATSVYRPPASPYDTWIGTDGPAGGYALNAGQLAFGAPIAISHYIAGLGDGVTANWGERLTASLKEFQVLALFDNNFNMAGATKGQQPVHDGAKFIATSPGVAVDTESAASVTVQGDGSVTPFSNRATLINLTNNTTSTAVTLPAAGSAGFTLSFVFAMCNSGTVVATVTSSSNINGVGTLVLPAKPSSGNPSCAFFWSNNSTWTAALIPGTPSGTPVAVVIASGTASMPTGSLTTNTCAAAVTVSATGVLSTDSIKWSYNAAPGMPNALFDITPYVTTNNVNFIQCNSTSGSQVPSATTINWEVVR